MADFSRALPALRRHRPPWNLARLAARFSSNIRSVEVTVEPFAQWWDKQNEQALKADGPLWVVLGDSTAQGVGASAAELGFIGLVHRRLIAETNEPWRVINLSMSGGRFADAVEQQIPVIDAFDLQPQLVSAVIGSNDLTWRRDESGILDDARRFVEAAPPGLVLSQVGERPRDTKRRGTNAIFRAAESQGKVTLYNVWDWPKGQQLLARDNFHPNDAAYQVMADHTFAALIAQHCA